MMYIDIKSEQSETQPHSHQEEKLHSASENPDEHPFVIELLSYIDLCMKHVLGSESAMEFIDVSKNNLRRKIRDRLRAKEFNENFDMKFHTYCNFCTKIIFFDEVAILPIRSMNMIMYILQNAVITLCINCAGLNT